MGLSAFIGVLPCASSAMGTIDNEVTRRGSKGSTLSRLDFRRKPRMEEDDFISKTQRKRLMSELQDVGAVPKGSTPEELASHVQAELAKWAPIVKASGAQID